MSTMMPLPPVRSKERFLVFGAPKITQAEIDEVVATLKSGWIGTGPKTARFQAEFAKYRKAQHAAAVSSATAALHLCMVARDLKAGDEVIVPALTFCATANAVIHAGGTPVIADIDPLTWNLDPADVARKITPRTKALMPVHLAGRPCDMDALLALARKHGLYVIEDCAHAIETEWNGQPAGTFGEFGCFSFYVTKNVVTGEGGLVLSKQQADIDRIRVLALHGMSKDAWKRYSDEGFKHYQVVECGFKYNMTDVQAALGLHQLADVEANWKRRAEVWRAYDEAFRELPLTLPAPVAPRTRHAFHLYQVLVDEKRCGVARDAFLDRMTKQGIGVGVHYLSLAEHPYYQRTLGWKPDDCPNALRFGRQTVSLPLSPKLTDEDVADVIEAMRRSIHA
jgi:dTDP-4-amino-4,6-dideoxygalactose transaminase